MSKSASYSKYSVLPLSQNTQYYKYIELKVRQEIFLFLRERSIRWLGNKIIYVDMDSVVEGVFFFANLVYFPYVIFNLGQVLIIINFPKLGSGQLWGVDNDLILILEKLGA